MITFIKFITLVKTIISEPFSLYAVLSYYLTNLYNHSFTFTFYQVVWHDLTGVPVNLQVDLSSILKDALGHGWPYIKTLCYFEFSYSELKFIFLNQRFLLQVFWLKLQWCLVKINWEIFPKLSLFLKLKTRHFNKILVIILMLF